MRRGKAARPGANPEAGSRLKKERYETMRMKLVNRGNSADILLIGRLDVNAAEQAEQALLSAAERFDDVTLDLEQLDYISSAGLRAIKSFYLAMRRKGGGYRVANIQQPVMDIFEATGFVRLLKL